MKQGDTILAPCPGFPYMEKAKITEEHNDNGYGDCFVRFTETPVTIWQVYKSQCKLIGVT